MKKTALPLLAAILVSFAAASSAWAYDCPNLYQQCQEALQKTSNNSAAKLCDQGIELHNQGKHDAAIATLTQGLEKLGVKGSAALPGLAVAQEKPDGMQEKAAELQVVRDAVAEGIIDREPVDTGQVFSPNLGRVYYFTEVESSGLSGEITHVWYFGDREMARVTLPVEGPRWRTWSSKGILPGWTGQWKVEAVSTEGTVLAFQEFSVGTAPVSETAPATGPAPAPEVTPAVEPEKR